MEQISRQLDYWTTAGETAGDEDKARRQDMTARVSNKIERIGQRIRSVEEVFSALKENLDRFSATCRTGSCFLPETAAPCWSLRRRGASYPRRGTAFLACMRGRSSTVPPCSAKPLAKPIEAGVNMVQKEIHTETGRRIQASLDFIHDDENLQGLGALVTLHDVESAEEIESELELSRRMAAIGRLTAGVGHEVKNPINAIVVHMELLKSKLTGASAPAVRHLEVIDAEIHRLDRVVQMLVDFSRPVELKLREQDLRPVIGDVLESGRGGAFHAQRDPGQPHARDAASGQH